MSKILKYFKKKTSWARSRKTDSTLSADSEHKGNDLPTVSSRKDPKVVDFVKREKGRSSSFLSESKVTPDSPIQDCLEIPELPNNDKKRDSWTDMDLSDSEEKISTVKQGKNKKESLNDVSLSSDTEMDYLEKDLENTQQEMIAIQSNLKHSQLNDHHKATKLKLQLKEEEEDSSSDSDSEEQDSHQNARVMYNTELKRMKELLQHESQEKQKAELTSRKLEQEMQILVNNMKKNEEDHSETRRLLELECSARALLKDQLSNLLHKQQEIETENKQNINNINKASSQLTEAKKRERKILMHTSTLQKQITILRADLTRSQTKSSLKETQLLEENETLRKQLEDARNEAKAISESLIQTVFDRDNDITRLNSELAITTNSFEREKRALKRLEVEVEQTLTHLNSVKQDLKQMQSTVLDQENQASFIQLRVSKLENEKRELTSQKEKIIQQANSIVEQMKVVDTHLEQEMARRSELQTEVCRLRRLVKTAKKKLSEKYMGEEDLKKMEELQVQLERETLRRCQLEKDNCDLHKELLSLKHLPQKVQRLEEERQELRTQMEATQTECRLVKKRARQETQSKPEQVYHFLQTPATSQEAQHSQLEQRIRMLESEESQAHTNKQDSLSRLDSNRTELERYRSMYYEERRLPSSLAVKPQRVDSHLSEANSKLRFANNAQDGASLGPSPGLMQSEEISRLSHVRPQQSQGVEDYLTMMRRELDRNISKELSCSTVKLDMASPHLSYMDRHMQEYREVLYKNNRI